MSENNNEQPSGFWLKRVVVDLAMAAYLRLDVAVKRRKRRRRSAVKPDAHIANQDETAAVAPVEVVAGVDLPPILGDEGQVSADGEADDVVSDVAYVPDPDTPVADDGEVVPLVRDVDESGPGNAVEEEERLENVSKDQTSLLDGDDSLPLNNDDGAIDESDADRGLPDLPVGAFPYGERLDRYAWEDEPASLHDDEGAELPNNGGASDYDTLGEDSKLVVGEADAVADLQSEEDVSQFAAVSGPI